MTETHNRLGVGPKWAIPTTLYFVVGVIAHYATYPRFIMTQASPITFLIIGISLVLLGSCTYAAALVSLRRGLRTGTLVTNGLYSITRHPLYASSILFIIPGVVLAFRCWLLLPTPIVAYGALRVYLHWEDDDLHKRYGDAFVAYKNTTNALLPTPPRWLRDGRPGQRRKD